MTTAPEPMPRARFAAIEAAIASSSGPSADDIRDLLGEAKRARRAADDQYMEADNWRESYRLTMGLSMDEMGALVAVRDASQAHPRPCRFPHEACICDDDEGVHEECFGIHNGADGYRDCDGNPI